MYAHRIDVTRKAVAIAMAVCGVGAVICIRRDDYLTGVLRYEPGIWRLGAKLFVCGIGACLIATVAFVIEYLARPTVLSPFPVRTFLVRVAIIVTVVGVGTVLTGIAFGPAQGFGAMIGTFLLLAACREQHDIRTLLIVLAITVLGLTLLSTQYVERPGKGTMPWTVPIHPL
jgi:hypothetical protein